MRRLWIPLCVIVALSAPGVAAAQPAPTNPCLWPKTEPTDHPTHYTFFDPSDPNVAAVDLLVYDSADPTRGPFFIGNRKPLAEAQTLAPATASTPACLGYPWPNVTGIVHDGREYWSAVRPLDAMERTGPVSERSNPIRFPPPPAPVLNALTGHRGVR